MKLVKVWLGCALVWGLGGCQEVKRILVVNSAMEVISNGERVEIPEGRYDVTLKISNRGDDLDSIQFDNAKQRPLKTIRLQLPPAKELGAIKSGAILESGSIRQPFHVTVSRDQDPGVDFVGLSFSDPESGELLATAHFKNSWVEDSSKNSFVKNYQNWKRSQRAVVFAIDGGLDGGGALDVLVNGSAKNFIAPWIYARYAHVEWLLSKKSHDSDGIEKAWKRAFEKSAVVDYMAFTHGGHDMDIASSMPLTVKKEHQLRYVYTEGCSSGSAFEFIREFNALAATGHAETSASPFFAFPLVRAWTYGKNLENTVKDGWSGGKSMIHTLNLGGGLDAILKKMGMGFWPSVEDMIRDSEPMLSWTPEAYPTQIQIGQNPLPERKDSKAKMIYQNRISELNRVMPEVASKM